MSILFFIVFFQFKNKGPCVYLGNGVPFQEYPKVLPRAPFPEMDTHLPGQTGGQTGGKAIIVWKGQP